MRGDFEIVIIGYIMIVIIKIRNFNFKLYFRRLRVNLNNANWLLEIVAYMVLSNHFVLKFNNCICKQFKSYSSNITRINNHLH